MAGASSAAPHQTPLTQPRLRLIDDLEHLREGGTVGIPYLPVETDFGGPARVYGSRNPRPPARTPSARDGVRAVGFAFGRAGSCAVGEAAHHHVRLEEAQLGVEVVQGGVAHLEVRSEFTQGTGDEYPVGAMRVLKRYQDSQTLRPSLPSRPRPPFFWGREAPIRAMRELL
jgi:hypothetical protein